MTEFNRETILAELTKLMVDEFEVDPARIKPESRLYDDLDLDSIDAIDMIVQLQEWTGTRFSPEDFKGVRTVGDVLDVVERIIAQKGAAKP